MRADEKRVFQRIIDGFESNYQRVMAEDNLTDAPLLRIAFYESCLSVVKDGPRMKSGTVQYNLIRYYERQCRKALKKLIGSDKGVGPTCT